MSTYRILTAIVKAQAKDKIYFFLKSYCIGNHISNKHF